MLKGRDISADGDGVASYNHDLAGDAPRETDAVPEPDAGECATGLQVNQVMADARVQLEAMLQHVPDRIFFKDTQSRFLMVSSAVAKRLGVADPSLLIGKTDFDFFTPAKAREFFEDEQKIIRTGQPLINKMEEQVLSNGEITWASVTKVPMRDKEGRVVGLVGIGRDITEQKRAENILRRSRDELEHQVAERTAELSQERRILRALIDHLPDAVYAKDVAARKTLANAADIRNIGCKSEAEVMGKTDFDYFPPDIAAKFFADDQAVLAGQPVLNREEYFFDADGRKHWLLTSKLPVTDAAGKIVGLVGIGREITSLKEAEEKLEAVRKELLDASRQAGMAEVATGVLHNVGNVLNSVNVATQLVAEQLQKSKGAGVAKVAKLLEEHRADLGCFLTEDERGRQVPAYLKQLGEHLDQERTRMMKEIEGLMRDIGHIKEIVDMQQNYATVSGVLESVELRALVEDALRIHTEAYERHGINVTREYESLPMISLDKHRILQILVNLLSNAKYACEAVAQEKKRVTLRLKTGGEGMVRIEVADNGVGIASENLTRIFSQGFTTRKGGHGFGLHSGALAAMEAGGSLTAHSDGPGRGATFVLELPVASAANSGKKTIFPQRAS